MKLSLVSITQKDFFKWFFALLTQEWKSNTENVPFRQYSGGLFERFFFIESGPSFLRDNIQVDPGRRGNKIKLYLLLRFWRPAIGGNSILPVESGITKQCSMVELLMMSKVLCDLF